MNHETLHGPGRPTDLQNLVLMALPTPAVRDALHAYRLRCPFPPDRRLPAQDRLHMTICSFGFVPRSCQPALQRIVTSITLEPLELLLCRSGALDTVIVMPARPSKPLRASRARY